MNNNKLMIFLIAVFAALPPFAIDTYAPAILNIADYFSVPKSLTIVTYTTYFIGYSIGIIIWGTISDIFGRKKILVIGVLLYIISTTICSVSATFWQLSAARMFQGFGDAACTTVSFAMLRDCYSGKNLIKSIASVGMVMMFAPIVAPFVGAYIISTTGKWQYIFHFLTAYGLFLLLCTFITPETNTNRSFFNNISNNYKSHLFNQKFIILSFATGLSFAAMFSFIGSSAVIYIGIYHLSKFNYAILFGVNATAIVSANFTLRKLIDRTSLVKIQIVSISLAIVIIGFSLITMYLFSSSLIIFILIMWLITFFLAISSNAMGSEAIANIKHAFGTATSISTFIKFSLAGIANYIMTLFSYQYLNKIMLVQQFIIICIISILYIYQSRYKTITHAA